MNESKNEVQIKKKMFKRMNGGDYSYLSDEMQFTSDSNEEIEYIEDFAQDKQFNINNSSNNLLTMSRS